MFGAARGHFQLKMAPRFRSTLERLLFWVYPEKCRQCDVAIYFSSEPDEPIRPANQFFCCDCWSKIKNIGLSCCPICSYPFKSLAALSHSSEHICGDCRLDPPCFTKAFTPYCYEGALAKAVQLLKYEEQVALAKPLAELLFGGLSDLRMDLVVGIPLHPVKLRSRSFNQSVLLAKVVSRHFSWPFYVDVLCRKRETLPQVGLSKRARQKNMRGVFSVLDQKRVRDKRILLIDDVYTTGATLKEGAKVLKKAGAKEVFVAAPVRMIFGV